MTHLPSVYYGKTGKRPGRNAPKEGTKIRALYDLFTSSPGVPVEVPPDLRTPVFHAMLANLTDIYGLDIRLVRQGSTVRGPSIYVLAGIWNGKGYDDLLPPEQLANLRSRK
jgi:hypothetical protein